MTETPSPGAIAQAFDLGRPTGPLAPVAAQSHTMWRPETEPGRFAVKQLNRDYSNSKYIEWYERGFPLELAAHGAGIPMARPIAVPGTQRSLAELPGDTERPTTVRVHEWVEGVSTTKFDVTPAKATAVGRIVGQVHALDVKSDQRMSEMFSVPTVDRWHQHVERATSERAPWVSDLEQLLPILAGMSELVRSSIDDGQPLILTHRDVHPKNVLVAASGELLLIDWDSAAPWPASHEIASVAIEWAGSDRGDPDGVLVAAAVQGYIAAGGRIEVRGPTVFGGFFCILLNWLEYNVRRTLGERLRNDEDREVGARELVRLSRLLPRFVRSADAWAEMLRRAR